MDQIGRYQILGELGRGAMGVVYRALDPAIGRPVAIKTIRLGDITDEGERERLRERLFREAQSAGIISHPGIVTVYDVGEQDDITYVAMEFVSGPTLEKLMSGEQPLEGPKIVDLLRQAAAALDFAHKKGIVHRDIKPANIMVNEDGTVKVTDFGVAKFSQSKQMTQAGTVLGTPNYMSPEQIEGKAVDGRSDQWALAVIAYELLTGEKPFPGEHLTTVLYKIVSEEPAPPHTVNPMLPWATGMVLGRALSKDPARRYPSVTEFVNALEASLKTKKDWKPLARGSAQSLPTAVAPVLPPLHQPARTARERAEEEGGGLFWKVIGAALAGLAVVAVLFVLGRKWFEPEDYPVDAAEATQAQAPRPAPAPPPAEPQPSAPTPSSQPQPQSSPAPQPSGGEAGSGPSDSAAETAPPAPETKPVVEKPAPRAKPAPTHEVRPPEPAVYSLQIVTNPPGASAVIDGDSSRTCSSPCNLELPAGRHTLVLSREGFRPEQRIIELNGPREVFVNMSRPTGTLRVESNPPGAQIYIDNELRRETTPATFVLSPGRHHITVVKDGRRGEQDVEVRDGALLRYALELNP